MNRKIVGFILLGLIIFATIWWWMGGIKDPFRYFTEGYGEVVVVDPQQCTKTRASPYTLHHITPLTHSNK